MTSKSPKRKKRILITAYHEIGHYLLIKKIQNDFPDISLSVEKIELCPQIFNDKGGKIYMSEESHKIDLYQCSTQFLEEFLLMNLAGFAAGKIFFGYFSGYCFEKDMLYNTSDYMSAKSIASILLERNESTSHVDEIINNSFKSVETYLNQNKSLIDTLAKKLYKCKRFSKTDLSQIDEKYF